MHIEVVYKELKEIIRECSVEDWNGHGAEAIDIYACQAAAFFIGGCAHHWGYPELIPEPDGSLGLLWVKKPERLLLSFHPTEKITWVLFTTIDKYAHGSFVLGEAVPKELCIFFNPGFRIPI